MGHLGHGRSARPSLPAVPPAPAILDCERWFVRRGVPHFIVHYDASEHIWTRTLPLLVVIYVLRGLYALDLDKGVLFNMVALRAPRGLRATRRVPLGPRR
jgi:hypothetical protein